MPIPLPNLDDHSYDDLVAEAMALLPALAPAWTDHNPSDPGITMLELLASLTEMLLFQVNQITPEQTATFLNLLNGPGASSASSGSGDLTVAIRDTVRGLRERYRAVTPEDYEYLVTQIWPTTQAAIDLGPAAAIRRVRCVSRRDLTDPDPVRRERIAPAHVTVVIVPGPKPGSAPGSDSASESGTDSEAAPGPSAGRQYPVPTPELTQALWNFLDPRRILTTRHHVIGPEYADITLSANLALRPDSPPDATLTAALRGLRDFLDPLHGGKAGTGWPFGRDVFLNELYTVLEAIPLIDYVEDAAIGGDRVLLTAQNEGFARELDDHQLPRLTAVNLTGYDASGRAHLLTWEATR